MKTSTVVKTIGKWHNLHREKIRKMLSKEGLYLGQHPILWELLNDGPHTQVELAQKLNVSVVTISNSVRRLADRGFVIKEADLTDQRKCKISITDNGKKAAVNCEKEFRKLEVKMFEGISQEDFYRLNDLFLQMTKNLEDYNT